MAVEQVSHPGFVKLDTLSEREHFPGAVRRFVRWPSMGVSARGSDATPGEDQGVDADEQITRSGDTVQAMKNAIRNAIIRGELRPGTPLTSVRLAQQFGVSRTPAREALRMLQEEGFVRGESNQRPRVAEWSADELETVFAERILLTVLCTRLTVPGLTDGDIRRMEELIEVMVEAHDAGESDAWRTADIEFHRTHMQGASPTLLADLGRLYERASMFRAIWLSNHGQSQAASMLDHPAILEACRARDPEQGGIAAARHLTRVALTLMTELAPGREPSTVRQALRVAGLNDGDGSQKLSAPQPVPNGPGSRKR
jgi:DNA-binding GntR family transcriptional regulator